LLLRHSSSDTTWYLRTHRDRQRILLMAASTKSPVLHNLNKA
jgi:hypothetical protein